jgi:hypothetical protein
MMRSSSPALLMTATCSNGVNMKKLTLAAAALLAALFLSSNAPAMTGGQAASFHTASYAMKVKHGCCRHRGCSGCGTYHYTVYPSCGRCDLYNYTTITGCCGYGYTNYRCGCACGYCSCGYVYGACDNIQRWRLFGWLY